MSEQGNCLTVSVDKTRFDPLDVLNSHSTKMERLPKCIELIQDHFQRDRQAVTGFKSQNVFVSKTEIGTFVFAVIDHRDPNAAEAITKNTLFTVKMTVRSPVEIQTETGMKTQWQKYKLTDAFENVPLVDLVKCQFEDGSLASVGLLCIPVEPCWTISNQNPFQNLDQAFKVAVAIKNRYESEEEITYPAHQNADDNQPWQTNYLSLTSRIWHFHQKDNQEKYLLMCVTHGDSNPYPLTSATPVKVKLILRSIAKYGSHLVHPYHTSMSIEPWYVKKENGYVHGLLAIPLRVSTEKEARFFEVVNQNPGSLRLEITTLEREY
jgi:hypothetical protein